MRKKDKWFCHILIVLCCSGAFHETKQIKNQQVPNLPCSHFHKKVCALRGLSWTMEWHELKKKKLFSSVDMAHLQIWEVARADGRLTMLYNTEWNTSVQVLRSFRKILWFIHWLVFCRVSKFHQFKSMCLQHSRYMQLCQISKFHSQWKYIDYFKSGVVYPQLRL